MSTSQSTIDFLMDQLSSLPRVRVRKMFGDHALYPVLSAQFGATRSRGAA